LLNAQIACMTVLNAAATGAMGLVAGMSLTRHAPAEHGPAERDPWRGSAGFAAAALAVGAAIAGWRSKARLPLVASAAFAVAHSAATAGGLPLPSRRSEVVSGETKLIRLYRRDARLSGLRAALQVATLGTLLYASARA
jgi:hypothetical protein